MEILLLFTLFYDETAVNKLPEGLLSALCYVESTHKISAINKYDGKSKSLGVCQIKYETAKLMGFQGKETELMLPENNIKYSAKYLKHQLDRYNNDIKKAVAAYNSGSYKENRIGAPINNSYIQKVFAAWASNR